MKKFYTARYDRVFKTILCDEDNKELLTEFLSRILKKKVEIVEFLQSELQVNTTDERNKTVDALVKCDNDYIHIELNSSTSKYLHTRNFIYFTSIYNKKTKRGEEYDTKTKFLHIDFTYGLNKKDSDYKTYYVMTKDCEKYVENIEIIEYNMDKITEYWYNSDKEKINEYKHLIMLDLEKEDLREISKGDSFMQEFDKKLEDLNEKETFQSAMTYEEDQKLILNTEKRLSFEQGIEQGIEQVIKEMLKKDMSIDTISEVTKLSVDEINKIKDKIEL